MSGPRVALMTTVSLAVYLGLAIAGEGVGRFFPRSVERIDLVTVALGVAALFTEGHLGSGVREDRSNAGSSARSPCSTSPAPISRP
jgi:hypothetical protein